MMTLKEYENLKTGDILTSDERDAVMITGNHPSGLYVVDCVYDDDKQDYTPTNNEYLLTFREVMKFDL